MSHGTHTNKAWHTYECDMSHVRMSHGTHTDESWLTYDWVMAHIWISHGTNMNGTWHMYEWVMAHIQTSHGTHMNESCHTYEWVMAHIRMSHGTHTNKSWHTYEWVIVHMRMSHGPTMCRPMNTANSIQREEMNQYTVQTQINSTQYSAAKTHWMSSLANLFPQISHWFYSSFAENDLHRLFTGLGHPVAPSRARLMLSIHKENEDKGRYWYV